MLARSELLSNLRKQFWLWVQSLGIAVGMPRTQFLPALHSGMNLPNLLHESCEKRHFGVTH